MRQPTPRQPLPFRQLCAVTRTVIEEERTIDDFEWRERVKDRIIALGFTYPEDLSAIVRAVEQVTRALERKWGARPLPAAPWSRPLPTHAPKEPRVPRQPHCGWTSVPAIIKTLQHSSLSAKPSGE